MLADRLSEVTQAVTDPAVMAGYEEDFTGRWRGRASAVVRPGSAREVAEVLRICAAEGVAVVPQGGNTGLVGGGVPQGGEVVLSLRRLTALGPVDRAAQQVTAGAGVVLADLQRHARAAGLDFGVDLAARDSATIGGMIATNAGGERVLRYGSTKANVVGVEAVLADGSIVSRLDGLPKDNTGFDLPFAASEGTLGVITAARLRLVPLLAHRATALLGLPSAEAALTALERLRALDSLEAAEFFLPEGLALVRRHTGLPSPTREEHAFYVLVECAAPRDPSDALYEALADVDAPETVVAGDAADRHRLWTYREAHAEAIRAATGAAGGVSHKLDVGVPLAALPGFLADVPRLAGDAVPYLFGHLAEANVHVNLLGGAADPSEAVLARVAELGGTISAEHGVGRAKAAHLHLTRTPAEIAALRAVKAALDPSGLLNPGVIFP
ncbi:FAD-binding oxidoreductase [Actinocorallia sp. A-T 12471]|uniref:FAD-binding oxidoreductase n=1 Tax=Actinocorallia sp. A-T 12471 TaxID=3089813 RepID=UPI0029CDC92A|nr:FAD-binding oxidoreductase [Actinocorallia sp. A-T 12471]MDX6742862.1 FAD-binding oxidoreductase [Actinocorallia sp. A-T 12471]